jgi:putative membrane protein
MMWYDGWGWGGWLAMTLMMLALLALFVWGLVLLWRATADPPARQRRDTPEAILAERLARGEIDPTEYEERLAALRTRDRVEAGPRS